MTVECGLGVTGGYKPPLGEAIKKKYKVIYLSFLLFISISNLICNPYA